MTDNQTSSLFDWDGEMRKAKWAYPRPSIGLARQSKPEFNSRTQEQGQLMKPFTSFSFPSTAHSSGLSGVSDRVEPKKSIFSTLTALIQSDYDSSTCDEVTHLEWNACR